MYSWSSLKDPHFWCLGHGKINALLSLINCECTIEKMWIATHNQTEKSVAKLGHNSVVHATEIRSTATS